ncbi:MAG: acetyl-CoA carboxylase carboxyl transferase subunit beta [Clostridiaceae bacterium]|jgi:acetyl-CoA carboxylase carboxyl transferase subunit beta|nr:acetyl-CoA carboxylase carboxyl transferase subunit beta [Clostridiaceae bacterium]
MLKTMFNKTRYATIPVVTSPTQEKIAKDEGTARLNADERLSLICDENSFQLMFDNIKTKNPLEFEGYEEKIDTLQQKTGDSEAITTGICTIDGIVTCIGVMNSEFLMGSMGSVVGERLTRLFEYATENKFSIIVFCASGGARMHEGIFSLMQMAKVSAAVQHHSEHGLLYVSVLTDPTTGGVTASFAMLGDVIIAEPNALIGFAGRRVIQSTISQQLPEDFQSAEFLLKNGFIDIICKRAHLKNTLAKILKLHSGGIM